MLPSKGKREAFCGRTFESDADQFCLPKGSGFKGEGADERPFENEHKPQRPLKRTLKDKPALNMRLLLSMVILFPVLLRAEYFVSHEDSQYEWAFNGTKQELKASSPPTVEPLQFVDGWTDGNGGWTGSLSGSVFRFSQYEYDYARGHEGDPNWITSTSVEILIMYTVSEIEFNEFTGSRGFEPVEGDPGAYGPPPITISVDGEPLGTDGEDFYSSDLEPGDYEKVGLDLSGYEIENQSPYEKNWRLNLRNSAGEVVDMMDSGQLQPGQKLQLGDYGNVPEGYTATLDYYDGDGNIPVGGSGSTQLQGEFSQNGIWRDGIYIPGPPTGTPTETQNNYDEAFQDWLDYHTTPDHGSLPDSPESGQTVADIRAGVEAGVRGAADSITEPIGDDIEGQTTSLLDALSPLLQGLNDKADQMIGQGEEFADAGTLSAGPHVDSAETALTDVAAQSETDLDDAAYQSQTEIDNVTDAFKTRAFTMVDGLMGLGGPITQGAQDIMTDIHDAFSALAVDSSQTWEIIPAGYFYAGTDAVQIHLGNHPWSTIKDILASCHAFLWVVISVQMCAGWFQWAAS